MANTEGGKILGLRFLRNFPFFEATEVRKVKETLFFTFDGLTIFFYKLAIFDETLFSPFLR